MSLPRYPEYKDSGVPWLGELPAHWQVSPIKRLLDIQNGADYKEIEADEGYPVIGSGGHFAFASKYIYDGESVLLGRKGTVDRPLHVDGKFWTVDTMYWSRIRQGASGRFCYYAATTIPFGLYSTNTALPSMTKSALDAHLLATPPFGEQCLIASFLDRETAKIDALITEQEKLLVLLAEKRQATIYHAVTRGLGPSVPMKDSGIPWVGKVPAHWEVFPIKRLSVVQRGASPRPIDDPRYFDEGGEYSWVRISDVTASDGVLRVTEQRLSELGASLSVPLQPGALFVSIAASVGKPCITAIKACIHDGFVYFPRLSIPPMFLFRVFEAGVCFAGLGKMGTQLNLNTETISAIEVALPPREELFAILDALEIQLGQIDALQDVARNSLSLLHERRSALIAAAVTGQVDVRGMAEARAK